MNTEPFQNNSTGGNTTGRNAGRNAGIFLLAKKESHSSIGEKFKLSRKRVSQICIDEDKRRKKAEKAEQLRSDFHKHNDINLKYTIPHASSFGLCPILVNPNENLLRRFSKLKAGKDRNHHLLQANVVP